MLAPTPCMRAKHSAGAFNEYLKRQGSLHPHLVKLTEFMVPCITGVVVSILFLYVDQGYCHISIGVCVCLSALSGTGVLGGYADGMPGVRPSSRLVRRTREI